ncbi:MAG TPA: ABC transporter permease [Chloroflexia bacterium]|nr:ABC transporter permease [Chloroflexia bacterium]
MLDLTARRVPTWRESLRTLRIAAWLGWQIEGNWADPFAFFIFTILRPMATALMLVVMYQVVAGPGRGDFFAYLFISNAFFVVVVQTMAGMAWVILDDREEYRMLKYIYTSPARKFAYLVGRATAKILIGLLTTLILLGTGALFLGLPVHLDRVAWGWLAVYFPLGLVILISLGLVLAGVALVSARHGENIGEVSAGMLLLFSSAYFPPDILPPILQQLSLALPVTYWLEGMRRALNGGVLQGPTGPISPILAGFDNGQLLAVLGASAIVCAGGSFLFYRWIENRARDQGILDQTTEH